MDFFSAYWSHFDPIFYTAKAEFGLAATHKVSPHVQVLAHIKRESWQRIEIDFLPSDWLLFTWECLQS